MVTIKDIAREAGVSHATVSYVLNGKSQQARISKKLSERIKELASTLGYRRNEIARSVVTGKTQVIGFLVHRAGTEHFAKLLEGVMTEASLNGYFVKVIYVPTSCTQPESIVDICRGQRLAGVISSSSLFQDFLEKLQQQLLDNDIPLAIGPGGYALPHSIRIISDDTLGGKLVFKHLYDNGHRRFIVVKMAYSSAWTENRAQGFIDAAEEAGVYIGPDNITLTEQTPKFNTEMFIQQLKKSGATAVFAVSDYLALAALIGLQQHQYSIPNDIAVAGYGDLFFGQCIQPALTTVAEDLNDIGRNLFSSLLKRIESKQNLRDYEEEVQLHQVRLIARESTKICLP